MKSLLKKYIQSVLSPKEFEQFHTNLNRSENEPLITDGMKSEWENVLQEEEHPRENPALINKIKEIIVAKEQALVAKKLRIYVISSRVAAVLLVGIILSSVWFYNQKQSFFSESTLQTITIPYGAKTQFALPDGSKVWLNSGSTLSYSSDFTENRDVNLEGEAFFDVVKSKVPFQVKTSLAKVSVLGTAFNVKAFDNKEFETTLERGKIKVLDSEDAEVSVVEPGEQVKWYNKKFVKEKVDTELFTSWKDGKLIFSREPFPDMIRRLERYYNVKVKYSATDFNGLWFSGTIENETLTEVMEMICKAAPVKYSYSTQDRKVTISAQ
ncbi:FecR family protein [Sunxiuqinia sp. A32]|uniref:FecR family protein n=1 Tax=Sunxiuqinia sp. A32 TaxID=3461496 RepID=UPI004045D6E3